ncbi:MAG TPA: HD domain-containing phosphohydrolase, partial [Chloroflexia bacterium]|nr:HD domain-containing phosphohydrolase [Chloroflexia bacterium]
MSDQGANKGITRRVRPALRQARRNGRAREEEIRYRTLLEEAADAILIADGSGRYVEVNEAACTLLGYTRPELLALTVADLQPDPRRPEALERFQAHLHESTYRLDRYLQGKDGRLVHVEIRATTIRVGGQLFSQAMCRDLSDQEALEAARSREHTLYLATVRSLAATVDARDVYTHSHSQQVAFYCRLIADELGLAAADVETIELAGLLHDIGKIAIPDTILQKPGRLTPGEWAVMRTHAARGADILSAGSSPALAAIVPMVRYHHERWSGGGYPAGLAGEAIPLGAAVIAAADAFDTITTARPYKPASTLTQACNEIAHSAGGHLHPEVAAAFLRVLERDQAAGA